MRSALIVACILLAGGLAAQSYTVSSGSVSYTDLASPTPSNLGAALQLTAAISPSGFSFQYFGTTYTSFKLGSGGYMIMGSSGTVASKYAAHSTAPGLVIAANWDYLAPGSSLYPATAPSLPPPGRCNYTWSGGILSVEWKNIPLATNPAVGVRMKVVINTSTGEIELQYGSVPSGCTGSANGIAHSAAISGPTGGTQEVVDATASGYINSSGGITSWPANRYVRFTPTSASVNTPPTLAVAQSSTTVNNGGTVNVNHGISLSALFLDITANDADADNVSISASITNLGSTGIVQAEWESASAGVPYTLNPTTGVFNTAAGATHTVTLTADDGQDVTTFTFDIVQAPAVPTPTITVSDGASVSYGQGASGTNRDFGSIDITAGSTGTVTITIGNSGAGNLNLSGFNMTGDAAHFVLDTNSVASPVAPSGSTTFTVAFDPSTAGMKVAQVSFTHNDPVVTNPFSFEVIGVGTSVTPVPLVEVHETNASGGVIANGAAASGIRAFGSMDITTTPSAPITIFVQNSGAATLTLGAPSATNADFTVNATGFPGSLAAGSSATFTVSFTPATVGSKSANIQFTHNDASTATPFSFQVTGVATSVTPLPIVVVHETNAAGAVIANGAAASGIRVFGTLDVASSPSAPITIFVQNAGTATLTLGAPFSTNSDFTVNAGAFPGSLAAGAGASFTVTFTPTTAGPKAASIQFTHNDASMATPFACAVSGMATSTAPGPGPGNVGGSGAGGGGGCIVSDGGYSLWLLIIAVGAGLGARTLRRRVR